MYREEKKGFVINGKFIRSMEEKAPTWIGESDGFIWQEEAGENRNPILYECNRCKVRHADSWIAYSHSAAEEPICSICISLLKLRYARKVAATIPKLEESLTRAREKHIYKKCTRCGEIKPLTAFYDHPKTVDRKQSRCIECFPHNVKKNKK